MNKTIYNYPKVIQGSKTMVKIYLLLFILGLLRVIYIFMSGFGSSGFYTEIKNYQPLFVFGFSITMLISYLGSFPDIETNNDGLSVEFIFTKFWIPWSDIANIKHVGSKKFGIFVVETKNARLSFFHRLSNLLATGSFNPAFYIHSQIQNFDSLMKLIRSHKRYGAE